MPRRSSTTPDCISIQSPDYVPTGADLSGSFDKHGNIIPHINRWFDFLLEKYSTEECRNAIHNKGEQHDAIQHIGLCMEEVVRVETQKENELAKSESSGNIRITRSCHRGWNNARDVRSRLEALLEEVKSWKIQ